MYERGQDAREVVVDRIRCDGFGMCAELLPELIELDDWGYPIVAAGAVPADLGEHARRAVAVCPVLALRLQPVQRARMTTKSEIRNAVAAPGG
jgi:ferredoxin